MPPQHSVTVPPQHTVAVPQQHTVAVPLHHTVTLPQEHTAVVPQELTAAVPQNTLCHILTLTMFLHCIISQEYIISSDYIIPGYADFCRPLWIEDWEFVDWGLVIGHDE